MIPPAGGSRVQDQSLGERGWSYSSVPSGPPVQLGQWDPVGVGEPIFDKLQSHLAYAMMSINACKGFEYGSGFSNVALKGSEMYLSNDSQLVSGGIAGGISDGNPIVFRCVFKPTASNRKTLEALCAEVQKVQEFRSSGDSKIPLGRHDACVAVRAVAVVEAMASLVVQDFILAENQ